VPRLCAAWDVALRTRLGYSAAQFAYMLSAVGWSFALVNLLVVPRLVRLAPPIALLRVGLAVAAVGRFALAAANTTSVLMGGFLVLALGQGAVGSLLAGLVAREAPQRAGYLLGLAEGTRGVAGVIGPLLSAQLYERYGTRAPAVAGGLCQVAAAMLAFALLRERAPSKPSAKKTD
jgi:predicted MFS family arabinose efflux permease